MRGSALWLEVTVIGSYGFEREGSQNLLHACVGLIRFVKRCNFGSVCIRPLYYKQILKEGIGATLSYFAFAYLVLSTAYWD